VCFLPLYRQLDVLTLEEPHPRFAAHLGPEM
jgi:hypothetical protein